MLWRKLKENNTKTNKKNNISTVRLTRRRYEFNTHEIF